jgi:hypothetical protein
VAQHRSLHRAIDWEGGKEVTGDIELAAMVVAVGMVVSAVIIGTALVIAAGRIRKHEQHESTSSRASG